MKIALPVWLNRISPVLDTATCLLVLTCKDGRELHREEQRIPSGSPAEIATYIAGLGLHGLICGALSNELKAALQREGVAVHANLCGDTEAILEALCCGKLGHQEFQIPGSRLHQPDAPVRNTKAPWTTAVPHQLKSSRQVDP